MTNMRVLKRNNTLEEVKFDKITQRIKYLIEGLDNSIDPVKIAGKVCSEVYDKISTSELDELAANICISLSIIHPDYGKLAAKIIINNHQKNTSLSFSETVELLYKNTSHGEHAPLVSEDILNICRKHKQEVDSIVKHDRDYNIDFFGFKTLHRAYLLKVDKKPVETPQFMWLRVALGIHSNNFEKVKETYDLLSNKYFTHATPTLFHSGTPRPQMSSCFLLGTEDSVEGIYKTITNAANISKWAGGIGIHISDIRSRNSYIRKTGGKSDGILPMLRVYNDTARYINQSGKRNGSFAMYLEPWHADVFEFLDAKKNHGNEDERARDLFYALWIPDIFMRRVKSDGAWSLMCPDMSRGLTETYGDDFDKLYENYEKQGKFIKQIKARTLWSSIINSQIETGVPYMLYKDACNKKSNQKNLGTIRSSNLCTEIIEYSDSNEYAVCNLASINLTKYVEFQKSPDNITIYTIDKCIYCRLAKAFFDNNNYKYTNIIVEDQEEFTKSHDYKTFPLIYIDDVKIGGYSDMLEKLRPFFNHEELHRITRVITRNLNIVIDKNFYPVPETKRSNMRHRPIGLGVQGLADVFMKMKLSFDSEQARVINREIFETIYHASLQESIQLAIENGKYETFEGSPLSQGKLQFDLWDQKTILSDRYDWAELRKNIIEYGVRNSLLVAPMPTASTSQILGNNEAFEPYTSNLYTRRTLAGEFVMVNKWLIKDLIDMNLWDQEMKERLMYYRGSIQKIVGIPKMFKDIYKTAWELKQKVLLDLSIDRGHFICQSQSLNVFCESPTYNMLTNIHFYGWSNGLKTGSYYVRSKAVINSQQFTINPELKRKIEQEEESDCLMCGS